MYILVRGKIYSYKKNKTTIVRILDCPMPPLILKFQFYAGYPFHYSLDFYFFFLFSFMSFPVMGIGYGNF